MKTNTKGIAIGLGLLFGSCALHLRADEQTAVKQDEKINLKTYAGIITTVDAKEKAVRVKGTFFSKTFNVADQCEFTLGGKTEAKLDDLRAGQKVRVTYKDASGVLVANRFVQEQLRYSGAVESIDPGKRTLTLRHRGFHKTFSLPDDCKVVLRDDRNGSLEDVKVGHHVTVVYELPGHSPVARAIAQTSATFVGTLDAIDASTRTVKAKQLIGDKKFNLADNCEIVVNGKPGGSLSDLRLGEKLALSYDPVDGVNVVTRIAPADQSAVTDTAKASPRGQK